MPAEAAGSVAVDAQRLISAVGDIFTAVGIAAADARLVAADLVAADLEGIAVARGDAPSHVRRAHRQGIGVARERRRGRQRSRAVRSSIDAGNALGQLTSRQAVKLAVERAREIGLAAVAVRNGFHFGTAGRYARMMAEQNCVGVVLSNTRPLMPAPGGAEALVGNNPIAIALPSAGEFPAEADMALSATAMGKIRLAAAAGARIPEDWAVDFGRTADDRSRGGHQGHAVAGGGAEGIRACVRHRSLVRRLVGRRGRRRGAPALRRSRVNPTAARISFWRSMPVTSRPGERFAERVRDQAMRVSRSKRGSRRGARLCAGRARLGDAPSERRRLPARCSDGA